MFQSLKGPFYYLLMCLKIAGYILWHLIYRIRSNYRTVRLGFSKLLDKRVVKYPPNKGAL